MSAIATITDEARIAADNLLGTIIGGGTPTVRLGVTGLSRAGKTVFITALVHNLVHGGRLPLFDPFASGRLAEARLMPQPDDDVPRFDYEAHVRDLVEKRVWPSSTRRISELRIVIEYESARTLKRTFGRGRLNLDIVDYPGEWLLDLALLKKSYAEWSAEALALVARAASGRRSQPNGTRRSPRRDPAGPEDEEQARRLAEAFTRYLRAARADEHALSMLPPGRFLMPGDLEGSPALTFAPLDLAPDHRAGKEHARGDDGAALRGLQDACRKAVLSRPLRPARPADRAGRHARGAECRAGGDPRPRNGARRRARRLPARAGELAHARS